MKVDINWVNLFVICILFLMMENKKNIFKYWVALKRKWWFGYSLAVIVLAIPVLILDLQHGMLQRFDKFENILAEFNGLIFDLLIVVIFLGIYERIRDRTGEIAKSLDELDDFKYWKSDESTFRRIGIIKRLVNNNVTVTLKGHNFKSGRLVDFDVSKLILRHCRFEDFGFDKCKFTHTNISSTYFINSTFNNIDFNDNIRINFFQKSSFNNSRFNSIDISLADFEGCTFRNTSFKNCDFELGNLKQCVFSGDISFAGSNLKEVDLGGALFVDLRRDELTQKFYEWIGEDATNAYIFERYSIVNLDDPSPWNPEEVFPIGSPRKFKKQEQGCFLNKIPKGLKLIDN